MELRQFPNPLCPMIYEELLQHDLSNTIVLCAVLRNLNWKTQPNSPASKEVAEGTALFRSIGKSYLSPLCPVVLLVSLRKATLVVPLLAGRIAARGESKHGLGTGVNCRAVLQPPGVREKVI